MRVSIPAERLLKEQESLPLLILTGRITSLVCSLLPEQASSNITVMFCGSVACMEGVKNAYTFWVESLKKRGHSEDLSIDGRKVL
jgi:hypothetical protein